MTSEQELVRRQTEDILKPHKGKRGKLITILQEIQAKFGYLPREAMLTVAELLGMPESSVYGVATFYNQFRLHPPGRHPIKVCMGTACQMKGGRVVLESWERELNIKVGETSPDREFSLERVACIGCCAMAPVAVMEETVYGRITPTKIKGLAHPVKREENKQENTSE
jgi:NADH-quinone oxidoreductase subunit E